MEEEILGWFKVIAELLVLLLFLVQVIIFHLFAKKMSNATIVAITVLSLIEYVAAYALAF